MQACPKPVIAAVEGAAAGAGMSLALAQALDLASQCSGGPHQAMAAIKVLCLQAPHQSVDTQMAMEAALMVQAQASEESREGIAAFLDKRPADFVKLR